MRPLFWSENIKGEMWPICHCGHLSELAVPKRELDTLLCAPWVLNKCLLAGWPAQMWEQCVFLSELGEIYSPNHFIWFKARSHKSACLLVLKSSGAGGTEGEGKTRTVRSKARLQRAQNALLYSRHEINRSKVCQSHIMNSLLAAKVGAVEQWTIWAASVSTMQPCECPQAENFAYHALHIFLSGPGSRPGQRIVYLRTISFQGQGKEHLNLLSCIVLGMTELLFLETIFSVTASVPKSSGCLVSWILTCQKGFK